MPFKDPEKKKQASREAQRRFQERLRNSKPNDDIERWRNAPSLFLYENFGIKTWSKQDEILHSVRDNDRTTVRSGNSCSKSHTAAGCMLWFLYTHYPSIVITTAPRYGQVRDIIWREAATMWHRCPNMGGDFYLATTRLNLEENWYAIGFATDEADKFQGYHSGHILIIVDEPSGVDEAIFDGIRGVLAGGNAKLLLIGNPLSMLGTYRDSHLDPGKAGLYNQIHISVFDNPNFTEFGITEEDILKHTWQKKCKVTPAEVKNGTWLQKMPRPYLATPKWVEEMVEDMGVENPLYHVRVKGEFPQQGIDTLIPLEWITQAVERVCKPEGPKMLGVDIARYGPDETVACLRQGDKVLNIWRWSKQNTMQTTNRLQSIIRTEVPDEIRVDVVNIGAGVVDRLKEVGIKVKGVNVGERSSDPARYTNLRAEIFWGLRERFQDGNIDIQNDPRMIAQLAGLKYDHDDFGKLKIQSKKDMRKKRLKSPDIADAIALAFMGKSKRRLAWAWG